jgi:hypothetical protein
LPDTVALSDNINTFENRLDRFWQNQDVSHDWRADTVGIGSSTPHWKLLNDEQSVNK